MPAYVRRTPTTRRHHSPARLLLLASLLAAPQAAMARTWFVRPDSTGDAPTIQAAVDSASTGDEVVLGPGRYSWTTQVSDPFAVAMIAVTKVITVRGEAGAAQTVLDAERQGRVVYGPVAVTLRGLTIRGGRAPAGVSGGGLRIIRGLVSQCVITDNQCSTVANGGGISMDDGRIEDCEIVANRVAPQGRGGGAALLRSRMLRCSVRDNIAAGDGGSGGGVYSVESLISDSRFEANTVGGLSLAWGGALHSVRDSVLGCVFSHNRLRVPDNRGAAIYGAPTLVGECLFVANEVPGTPNWGAAVFSTSINTRVERCTFVRNSSGVHNGIVTQCIIAWCTEGAPCAGIVNVTCTNAWGNPRGQEACRGAAEDGNMSVDPEFCAVAPEIDENASLQSDSPCLHTACGRIGARDVGCEAVTVEPALWSTVKLRYR